MLLGNFRTRDLPPLVVCVAVKRQLFNRTGQEGVSVPSLIATSLTYGYKVRYESKVNVVLKVFDSWISLKILRSKVTALFVHHNRL